MIQPIKSGNKSTRLARTSLRKYSMSASLSVGLSFAVATMAKSAKMVPVMLLGSSCNFWS